MSADNLPPSVGFNNFVGYKVSEWGVDHACVTLEMDTHHLNSLGVSHGGVLLSALDYACGMSGCYRVPPQERRLCMTLSLTTNFVSPLHDGLLRATAVRVGGGKSTFFSDGKIIDEEGKLIASATGTFRLLSEKQ